MAGRVFDCGDYILGELHGKVLKKPITLVLDFSKREIFLYGPDSRVIGLFYGCPFDVPSEFEQFQDQGSTKILELLKQGFDVAYNKSPLCPACERSGGLCWSETDFAEPTCLCRDRTYSYFCGYVQNGGNKRNIRLKVGGIVTSAAGITILVILTCYMIYWFVFKKSSGTCFLLSKKRREHQNIEAFLRQYGSLAPKAYSYSDIRKMTIHCKRSLDKEGMEGSIKERALIYEFMPNGSLDQHIYCEDSKLGWEIALGIGRGLEYLHRGCNARILHFDIKPHNILLDEDFCPKISDFGLAKLCLQKESMVSMLEARGTIGYIAPKVFSRNFGGVSHKSDVYSYGMMVLEMIGGRRNYSAERSHHSEIYFPRWAYQRLVTDEDLNIQCITTKEEEEVAKKMILVGLWCIQTDPSQRPSMSEAIEMLEGDLRDQSLSYVPPHDQKDHR
ncbi:hypothetical protein T459_10773 [Capsicum annuum]|uniref:Protein kinase domain-containing protein n=1 Tax=Capsicum annuum TaxID=4072 RepID=A0A2G3A357_CAPAN|nr:putative serine/threonine-protein kinase HT1-like [Capsicum annuum]PHT88667.1 hypothetical protein T459_10773 [Capsicum annuum]